MQPEMVRRTVDGGASDSAAAPDARLRRLADAALHRAALAARTEDRVDSGVRELMREVCTVARERGLRAEEVLLVLKEAWRALPEGLRVPRHQAGEVLARAITVCIHEYYAQGDGRQ